MTYYMPLDSAKDLYISANAELGDIELYASFADQATKNIEIMKPTKEEHIKGSKEIGHSQMIHFPRSEIKENCDEFEECMVLISVQGTGGVEFNEYSITSYYGLRRLIPNSPSFAVIDEGTMAYFLYKSYCDD